MADFVSIAKTDDVPAGTVKTFQAAGKDLAIANVDGNFFAIDNVCTHDGGPLGEGQVFGQAVECPRHGARFDVKSGRAIALPAVVPVKTYPVQIEGDDIKVDVDPL
jgi:3-phenylpropionate/trans-cinnamate dioxygenase ferredoxin component